MQVFGRCGRSTSITDHSLVLLALEGSRNIEIYLEAFAAVALLSKFDDVASVRLRHLAC